MENKTNNSITEAHFLRDITITFLRYLKQRPQFDVKFPMRCDFVVLYEAKLINRLESNV